MKHSIFDALPQHLYRDTEKAIVLGVCAGIAERYDWPVWLIRLAALAIGWVFVVPAVVAYLGAALIMPQRPLRFLGEDEHLFWHNHGHRS